MLDYIRYRTIDRCIRDKSRNWDWEALAEECASEIEAATGKPIDMFSKSTIKHDIIHMRKNDALGWFCPIKFIKKKKGETDWGYRYTDPNFKISDESLNKQEINEILKMITLFRQHSGLKVSPIINAINKLGNIIFEYEVPERQIIELEQPTLIREETFLDKLYECISEEKAINITYKKFQKPEPYSTIVSPYLLKEYDNRWYLIAYSHERQALRTYGLERIQNVKPSLQEFIRNESFDSRRYFKHVIGLTKETDKVERVVFKVYRTDLYTVDYVRTRPIHHTQKEIETQDNYSVFSIDVIPNRELEAAILSYGDFLEILEPLKVKNLIKTRIDNLHYKYS